MKEENIPTVPNDTNKIIVPPVQARQSMLIRNVGEPIKLTGVNIHGVAAEAARPNEKMKVWTRLALTSDEPIFHRVVDNLERVLTHHAQEAGKSINLSRANSILLVIHPDNTAELWIDAAAVSLKVLVKKDMQAGSIVFERDIADVTEMYFPCVDIQPTDRILYLFQEGWRFALFFDLHPEGNLSLDEAAKSLGALYRRLKYRHLYDILTDNIVFSRLVQSGWFPFVEIIGGEFKALAEACESGFDLNEEEASLLQKFNHERLDRMFARWITKPHFKLKERILQSAVKAYKMEDWVAVLKIVLTEIEGILAEAYKASAGKSAKIKTLLNFAIESAERKAGGHDTLLFPSAFAKYLDAYTFANFDPSAQIAAAGSRHAVGHGAANADSYTQTRALQALLTLDQLAFYT